MNRRQTIIMGAIAGVVAVAVLVLWGVQRRADRKRITPAWLDAGQPAEQLPAAVGLTAAQSWAANRCGPINASCADRTAGRRIRREYPGSLAESSDSFIQAGFQFEVGC